MVELGQRYRAGKGGAHVVFADGSEIQLVPFGRIRFETQPKKIEGRLLRVGRPGHLQFEAPTLEPEVKMRDEIVTPARRDEIVTPGGNP